MPPVLLSSVRGPKREAARRAAVYPASSRSVCAPVPVPGSVLFPLLPLLSGRPWLPSGWPCCGCAFFLQRYLRWLLTSFWPFGQRHFFVFAPGLQRFSFLAAW